MKRLKKLLSRLRGEQNIPKLIEKGLKIGKDCTIMHGCIIDPSHCWHIEIGNHVILAPRVHILAHDASIKLFLNYSKISNVRVGNNVFIGAGTIILPGVTIGDDVIIGAGSVVTKNIPGKAVAVGNPAKVISTMENYLEKEKANMQEENTFNESFTERNPLFNEKQKRILVEKCSEFGKVFVK